MEKIEYERMTLADFGLEDGIGEMWTPDICVALWHYKTRRLMEATYHQFNTGEKIWAKTTIASICAELDISEHELEVYGTAGMLIEEDRQEQTLTDEEREFKAMVEQDVKEFLDTFDFDTFYAAKAAAEAEEAMLESMYKEDDQ